MLFLSTLFLSLFLTVALIPVCCKLAFRVNAVDLPDQRKVHTQPIPRCGGIAMAIAAFFAALIGVYRDGFVTGYALGCGLIFFLGVIDDLWGLGFKAKFAAQIISAIAVILIADVRIQSLGNLLPDGMSLPYWVSVCLTLVVVVGVTNAINLSDGLDGLAGGICLLSLSCIAYLAHLQGDAAIALISAALCGAIFGFLRFNTYPATLFMGDTGSQLLGFSTITLALALTQGHGALSPLVPLIILGLPVLDTVNVMVQRYAQGRPLFAPDKSHFHHRLIRLGLFHSEAVFVIYVIQAVMVICALLFRFYSEWVLLTGFVFFAVAVSMGLTVGEAKQWKTKRYHFVDRVIKGRMRVLRERNVAIQICFRVVKYLLPLFLLATALLCSPVSLYFSPSCLVGAAVLATWMILWPATSRRFTITCLYLLIPFLLYFFEADNHIAEYENISIAYNLFYVLLVACVILTVKLTRRRKGFRVTPLDFLTILIALALSLLPGTFFQAHKLGIVAVKMVVLFFSYEVLIGELRGKLHWVGWSTIIALVICGIKGVL